jgi:hypothetical protein
MALTFSAICTCELATSPGHENMQYLREHAMAVK